MTNQINFKVIIAMQDAAIFAHAIRMNEFGLFHKQTGDILKEPFMERFIPVSEVVLSLIGLARINSDLDTIAKLNAIQDLIEMYQNDPKNLEFAFDVAPVIEGAEPSKNEASKPLTKFDRIKAMREEQKKASQKEPGVPLSAEQLAEVMAKEDLLGSNDTKKANDEKKAANSKSVIEVLDKKDQQKKK